MNIRTNDFNVHIFLIQNINLNIFFASFIFLEKRKSMNVSNEIFKLTQLRKEPRFTKMKELLHELVLS